VKIMSCLEQHKDQCAEEDANRQIKYSGASSFANQHQIPRIQVPTITASVRPPYRAKNVELATNTLTHPDRRR
jgi:hypothetical protein